MDWITLHKTKNKNKNKTRTLHIYGSGKKGSSLLVAGSILSRLIVICFYPQIKQCTYMHLWLKSSYFLIPSSKSKLFTSVPNEPAEFWKRQSSFDHAFHSYCTITYFGLISSYCHDSFCETGNRIQTWTTLFSQNAPFLLIFTNHLSSFCGYFSFLLGWMTLWLYVR